MIARPFVFHDWPFLHTCSLLCISLFYSWLSFQRLCLLLWGYITYTYSYATQKKSVERMRRPSLGPACVLNLHCRLLISLYPAGMRHSRPATEGIVDCVTSPTAPKICLYEMNCSPQHGTVGALYESLFTVPFCSVH